MGIVFMEIRKLWRGKNIKRENHDTENPGGLSHFVAVKRKYITCPVSEFNKLHIFGG